MNSEPLCEVGYAGLSSAVSRDLGKRSVSVHRGDVDYITALTGLSHVKRKYLSSKECCSNVKIENELKALGGEVEEVFYVGVADSGGIEVLIIGGGSRVISTRTVDKDVAWTELLVYLGSCLLEACLFKTVCLDSDRGAAILADLLGEPLGSFEIYIK